MSAGVKIRGIYSTALTRLLLDSGYRIVDPPPVIQERFLLGPSDDPSRVSIRDRPDGRGVDLLGEAGAVETMVRLFQERLEDAVLIDSSDRVEFEEGFPGPDLVFARLEFGGFSRSVLDEIRASVVPTLARHHRLRRIDPDGLEQAETELQGRPELAGDLAGRIFAESVLTPLMKSVLVSWEHVKISGRPIRPREGTLIEGVNAKVLVKRSFQPGRYDGLDLPIEAGDYGITELEEGLWHVRNSYYSSDGRLKGEYFNVNTPVELYPFGARYIDLELDVVRRAGTTPCLLDADDLLLLRRRGLIGPVLERKAKATAEELMRRLSAEKRPGR